MVDDIQKLVAGANSSVWSLEESQTCQFMEWVENQYNSTLGPAVVKSTQMLQVLFQIVVTQELDSCQDHIPALSPHCP